MAFPWYTQASVFTQSANICGCSLTLNKICTGIHADVVSVPAMGPTGKGQSAADNQSALQSENYIRKTANFMKLESRDNIAMSHSLFCKMFKELIYTLPLVFCVTLKCVAIFHLKGWMTVHALRCKSKIKEQGKWQRTWLKKMLSPKTLAAYYLKYMQNGICNAQHTNM